MAGGFDKHTLLHRFIEFVVDGEFYVADVNDKTFDTITKPIEDWEKAAGFQRQTWIEQAFDCFGIEHQAFLEYLSERGREPDIAGEDLLSEYYLELRLSGPRDELIEVIAEEVFSVVFLNRQLMLQFNSAIANHVEELRVDEVELEYQRWFERNGVLRRAVVPAWARRAIFYRDRGCCALCRADVSYLLSLNAEPQIDHIVPLSQGGANDVTNLQLLCGKCNRSKGSSRGITSAIYERWF